MKEDQIQKLIIDWAKLVKYNGRPLADYIHHSPNGGKRGIVEATNFKRMGTQKGYPDLIIDIAKQGYHGLRIELKKDKRSYPSKDQKERLKLLNEQGYKALVCRGFDETVETIKEYLK